MTLLILSIAVMATAQNSAKPRGQATTKDAKAQAALAFVTEYIRELSAIESIRDAANKEITQGNWTVLSSKYSSRSDLL